MPTLLHIDASPRGDYSISRQISAAAVKEWSAKNPGGKVIERDVNNSNMTFVDLDWIMGSFSPPEQHSESHKKALELSNELVAELLSADFVVIGTPMYNFAIPAVLKAWVDHVVRPGRTFSYTSSGPQGLAGGRKVVVAVASGGAYEPSSPYDHEIPYLRHILGFMGITDVSFVQAGGTTAVTQGKISAADYLAPFLAKAKSLV